MNKKAITLMFGMFLILLVTPMISADFLATKSKPDFNKGLEIANKKIGYNSHWKQYEPVEIKNWFGLG